MTSQRTIAAATALLFMVGVGLLFAEEPTTKRKPVEEMSISDIMQEAHKKPSQLLKKVATGQASDSDRQRLKSLYEALAKTTPPNGSAESWEQKTTVLVQAVDGAIAGEPSADAHLFKAANCAACHQEHK